MKQYSSKNFDEINRICLELLCRQYICNMLEPFGINPQEFIALLIQYSVFISLAVDIAIIIVKNLFKQHNILFEPIIDNNI